MSSPQPAISNVPASGNTPQAYVSPSDATNYLMTRWGLTPGQTVLEGHVLIASMNLDEEGPFVGVKVSVEQDRQWPRTFKYGWPNLIAAPSPMLVSQQRPGAFYLDYEGVVPQQVVDWVCLEVYRITTLPWDRGITQESVTGASVHYSPPPGQKGWTPSMLEVTQAGLLSPFLRTQGHTAPFVRFSSF